MTDADVKNMKRSLALALACALLAGLLFTIAGCNTIAGIGADVSDAAKWTMDKVDYGFSGDNRQK